MREIKILVILVFFIGLLYWGVEPFAHSKMHAHVAHPDHEFKDVDGLNGLKGDATKGAELVVANCIACHSIKKAGFPPVMDDASSAAAYGVTPPDLSTAGYLYHADYLAALLKTQQLLQKQNISLKMVQHTLCLLIIGCNHKR